MKLELTGFSETGIIVSVCCVEDQLHQMKSSCLVNVVSVYCTSFSPRVGHLRLRREVKKGSQQAKSAPWTQWTDLFIPVRGLGKL